MAGGCFLTATDHSQGTLHVVWSRTAVPGALAYFAPRRAVPEFKYRGGGSAEARRRVLSPFVRVRREREDARRAKKEEEEGVLWCGGSLNNHEGATVSVRTCI